MKFVCFLLCTLTLLACTPRHLTDETTTGDTLALQHASLLTIVEADSFTTVAVADAWHKGQTLHQYVLVPKSHPLPHNLPEGTLVRTPLEHATVFSAVHAALLNDFGYVNHISGMCDMEYVIDSALNRSLRTFSIPSMGASMQPNVEKIAQSQSDALLVSPFKDNSYGPLEKLGIPIIECADYMETSALGRAEWMRFFGRLFGFGARADSVFSRLETRYQQLAQQTKALKKRPRLIVDRRESGTWYVPGGKSTVAQLFKDAGFDYFFAKNGESGGVAVPFEEMMRQGISADIWIIRYGAQADLQLSDLATDDRRYTLFRPWKAQQVYGCNTFMQPYYESTPFHPDVLLEELIRLAHPQLLPPSENTSSTLFHRLHP